MVLGFDRYRSDHTLDTPSRLKGIETRLRAARIILCRSLDTPSRLKGMETFFGMLTSSLLTPLGSDTPSRLKGIETQIPFHKVRHQYGIVQIHLPA